MEDSFILSALAKSRSLAGKDGKSIKKISDVACLYSKHKGSHHNGPKADCLKVLDSI